ncbi:MAG: DNA polymerase I [Mitsuokella jalaludinii]|uniref:DNA polymerase I n=1 Tax=Mitsuokella jalaludinii TaxID=187979 RepID=UPI00242EB358|nr:DNA polymerase I [Mitsuokella jalaludinii]MCI7716202.1 DNA polymerase I [Mitsuokella jalaludinii]MDD7744562.1 DNA polymerase I [Mitsuokella jalaludinii]
MKQEQNGKQKRFLVLDGSSLIFRAFYALPGLSDSHGQPTGAIFGFSNMLTKLMAEQQPDLMVLAFDKSRHTFRTERYADYKGTRDKTPEELLSQFPLLREFAANMGIPFLEKDNYEADDIIGTLATQAAAKGYDVRVITGDRDALQLVRPNLRVLLTKKGISEIKDYDTAAFEEEYGFEPLKLIDLKGLMGDTSDNIPGVPGVGPKTASKLLLAYGSVENVLAHVGEVSGKKLKENLQTYADQARLSKELATIELHVPDLAFAEEDYRIQPDMEKMQAFCDDHELRAVWRNFERLYGPAELALDLDGGENGVAAQDLSYDLWDEAAVKTAARAPYLAVSGIFSGLAPFASLEGLAVVAGPDAEKAGFVARDSAAFPALLQLLESDQQAVVFGLKRYDQAGLRGQKAFFDVELAAYLLEPERSKYALSELSQKYLQEAAPESFDDEKAQAVWEAKAISRLYPLLGAKLEEEKLTHLMDTIELPLVEVLAGMEQNGVYVNRAHLAEKTEEVAGRLQTIEAAIYEMAGHDFNLNSPKQLGVVLFEELGLPVRKKTKTGYSTNAEVLESLRLEHPIIEQILAYRLWSKLKSTYLDGIAGLIRTDTGRVHTNFNQTVTATGRLSSSDPNLQNIPVRTEEGRMIRALFEPGEGYDCLLSADYSQIELRLLAHMSGDENFIDAFKRGQDIHARTAAEVFGIPLDEVTPELRRHAKAVNFGIVYGISDFGLARNLHISRKEAGDYISRYFTRYPGVRAFMDKVVAEAHETGYVTTMFGRRRELPAIKSRNFNQRMLAERMAMNTPIQGTAADVIKLAMIAAFRKLKEAGLKSRILLQVHDELVLEVKESELETVQAILHEAMENVVSLSVPLSIDVHWGRNWAEAK